LHRFRSYANKMELAPPLRTLHSYALPITTTFSEDDAAKINYFNVLAVDKSVDQRQGLVYQRHVPAKFAVRVDMQSIPTPW